MVMLGSPGFPLSNLSQPLPPIRPPQSSSMAAPPLFNTVSQSKLFPPLQDVSNLSTPAANNVAMQTRTPFTPITNSFATNPFMSAPTTGAFRQGMSTTANPGGISSQSASSMQAASAFRQPWQASAMAQPIRPASQMPQAAFARPGVGNALGANVAGAAGTMTEALSPAEETGQKVGELVTTLLEENPALQEKLQNIDFDALQQDLEPKVEAARAKVQQAIKPIPRAVDRKLIRLFDTPEAQEMATQFDEWLRKPPDQALMAAANAPSRPNRPGALEEEENFSDPYADDPYAEEEELAIKEPPAKKSTLENLKSKVWPFNKDSNKENEPPALERTPRKRRASEISDTDLDAMLNESLGEPGRAPRRRRPLPPDEELY